MGRGLDRFRPARLMVALFFVAGTAKGFTAEDAARVYRLAEDRYAKAAARIPQTEYPQATGDDGRWVTLPNTDRIGWTQGFFPGSLWFLYELTGDPKWSQEAAARTRNLEAQKTNRETHDLGFKMFPSFGAAYRITGDPYYRDVLLTSAESLASRYRDPPGIISTGDWNPRWALPLVTDTMMNLELLVWAAQNGGDPVWQEMAVQHSLTTLQDMVRADGGTWHVVDYDPSNGAVRFKETFQGYSDESTWSRGQAWAIYGYSMMYRYTRDVRMLDAAKKVTEYYLQRLPVDLVPNWDFDAPSQLKDSSAAAAVASALIELSDFVEEPDRTRYLEAAEGMLDSLASPAYFAEGVDTEGLLLHAVGHLPANKEIDVSLIYGDYYFLEAVMRFEAKRTVAQAVPTPEPQGEVTPPPEEGSGCSAVAGESSSLLLALLAMLTRRRRMAETRYRGL